MTEQDARDRRNDLLFSSDWTHTADAPLTGNEQSRWRVYRQALRDLPNQEGFPDAIEWPTEPERDPPWIPSEHPFPGMDS